MGEEGLEEKGGEGNLGRAINIIVGSNDYKNIKDQTNLNKPFPWLVAMEGKTFSGLKDQLKTPSPPKPTLLRSQSIPASWGSSIFSNPNEANNVNNVADEFVHLSLEECSLSFVDSLDATLSFSSSFPSSCLLNLSDVQSEASSGLEEEIKNVETKKYVAFGNSTKKKGLFPPPISCLKLFNKGTPYGYLNYNEETDSFVLEEIKIPQGDMLRASRSGGRLRLTFVISDDESSDIEEEIMEEEDINGTVE
ncbi:unnamed protein product [Dovyalis caffra]|uniref:FAF domain-containing protein n=1 Tax=Dovyalis caffra TaxID=77055 RepID=A0AAV1QWN4_9ROSI|nr:unnamed protein product [Dovyalis caffra]